MFTGIDALQLATNGLIYADAVQYVCLLPFHVHNVRNMRETLHINKPGCSKINGIAYDHTTCNCFAVCDKLDKYRVRQDKMQ